MLLYYTTIIGFTVSVPARLHGLDSNDDNMPRSIPEPQLALMPLVGDCRRDGSMPLIGDRRRNAADHNAGELTKAHELTPARTRRAHEHGLVCAANLAAFFALDHCLYIKEKFTTEGSATQLHKLHGLTTSHAYILQNRKTSKTPRGTRIIQPELSCLGGGGEIYLFYFSPCLLV